jgi:conjugal transfer pilus assembly protein TraU
MNVLLRLLLIAALIAGSMDVRSQATTTTGGGVVDACPDSGFYSKGKVFTDLCWDCFFPMSFFGMPIGFGSRGPAKLPSKRAAGFCVCPGHFGYPAFGITWGMWVPAHVIEVTRRPWCSPTIFGTSLGGSAMNAAQGFALAAMDGGAGDKGHPGSSTGAGGYYNFHWMTHPVGETMDALMNNACSKSGADLDYVYFSEIDPTWESELLALYTHPEIKLFTAMAARAACVADTVAVTARKPIDQLYWCVGAWGSVYPFSGKVPMNNIIESQMLAATHGLAAMHRRTLARVTYGNKALCRNRIWFILPKQQYQFQNFWPFPQRTQAQWLGTPSMKFGQWRKIPVRGEDRVLVEWRYQECCITFW